MEIRALWEIAVKYHMLVGFAGEVVQGAAGAHRGGPPGGDAARQEGAARQGAAHK